MNVFFSIYLLSFKDLEHQCHQCYPLDLARHYQGQDSHGYHYEHGTRTP